MDIYQHCEALIWEEPGEGVLRFTRYSTLCMKMIMLVIARMTLYLKCILLYLPVETDLYILQPDSLKYSAMEETL